VNLNSKSAFKNAIPNFLNKKPYLIEKYVCLAIFKKSRGHNLKTGETALVGQKLKEF
jgi:hypothetical protein